MPSTLFFSRGRASSWVLAAAFFGLLAVFAARPAAAANVCFYEHAHFGGWQVCAPAGAVVPRLASDDNDQFSSVRVPSGLAVTFCEHINFGGRCQTLTGDSAFLGNWWNDRISSFRIASRRVSRRFFSEDDDGVVESYIPAEGKVCFFEHANYQGRSFCVRRGAQQSSLVYDGWNDIISSIQVGPGASVDVCEHVGFGGRCRSFHSSRPFVGDRWNDIISSFAVR